MDTPTSRIIEEAVAAIKRGEVSLATGADRYGKTWAEIEPQVRLELTLDKAAQTFKTNLPPLDLDRMWGKIEQGMGQNRATSAADSGSLPGVEANPLDLPKITLPVTIKPAVQAQPVVKPAKLPIKLSNWRRKPLSWAAAFLLVSTIVFSSLVGVAQAAEPGDNLYDFKVWLDGAGQAFALSADNKAQAALSYAEHRLSDIEHAARQGRLQYIPAVVNKYGDAIETARQSANNSWSQEQRLVLEQQQAKLTEIKNTLPTDPEAVSVGQDLDQARMRLVMPPPQPNQVTPTPTVTTQATATVPATATAQPSLTPTITDPTTVSAGGSKNNVGSLPGWARPGITTLPVSPPTPVPAPLNDDHPTTVPPTPTPVILAQPPTAVPPTAVPPTPTAVPPTAVPPTTMPPAAVPPTAIPPTAIPTTLVPPTAIPPTPVPTTLVPPTAIPTTLVPPTPVPTTPVPTINLPTAVPPISVPSVTTPAVTTPSLTDVPKTEPPDPKTPKTKTPKPKTAEPETPAPNTPAPNTPAPNTPAPNTPDPNTPKPNTPNPNTPAPNTPDPNTPAPNTPAPNTPGPNTPAPNTPAPNTPGPNTPAPESPGPNTPNPQSPHPNTPAPNTPGPNSARTKES